MKNSRTISDRNRDPDFPVRFNKTPIDNPLQKIHINITTTYYQYDFLVFKLLWILLVELIKESERKSTGSDPAALEALDQGLLDRLRELPVVCKRRLDGGRQSRRSG